MAEREWDPFRLAAGLNANELAQAGSKIYPEEKAEQNQQAHRLGSKLLTDRYGPAVSQGLGVANEVYEAGRTGSFGDAIGDFGANARGVIDSYWQNPNSPQGLARMIMGALKAKESMEGAEMPNESKPWEAGGGYENPAASKLKKRTADWKKKKKGKAAAKKSLPKPAEKTEASTAEGAAKRQKGWLEKIKDSGFRQ
jgi:hypothetical protein